MRAISAIVFLAFLPGGLGMAAAPARSTFDPGISAHTIKLGGVIDQTGRGSIISNHILAGYNLAVKEINARGGINGRQVDYRALSDNYDPSQTLPQLKQLVESDNVFAVMGVFGSDDAAVAVPYTEQHRVPLFDPIGGGVSITGKHWVWQTEPDYGREGRVIAKFAATKLHATRVAVLYQVGIGEPQVAALRKELARYRAKLVGDASYQSTSEDLSAQAIHLRSLSPDLIVLNGTPTPTADFVKHARLLGYKPKYGFLANYPMGDPLWLALIGSNGEGSYVSSYADLTGKNKVAAAYRSAIARYSGERYSNYGLYGYFNASLLFRALQLAGHSLSRVRLQSVLNTRFRHYDTSFTGRLNWTPSQHYGSRQFKIYQIRGRDFVPVTGWISP